MSANRSSLDRFINKLPDFFAADVIRIEKVRLSGRAETNWDMPARQVMKQKFDAWLKEELDLSAAELDQTLFVEGLFGDLPARTRAEFFGSQCCPDMALKSNDGYTIAVELDHGSSGSSLRNALTKASFNVIVGGFDLSIVLFFVEPRGRHQRETKFDPNHPVLRLFKDRFSTSVFFISNYELLP